MKPKKPPCVYRQGIKASPLAGFVQFVSSHRTRNISHELAPNRAPTANIEQSSEKTTDSDYHKSFSDWLSKHSSKSALSDYKTDSSDHMEQKQKTEDDKHHRSSSQDKSDRKSRSDKRHEVSASHDQNGGKTRAESSRKRKRSLDSSKEKPSSGRASETGETDNRIQHQNPPVQLLV